MFNIYESIEKHIMNIFRNYLDSQGYVFSNSEIQELVDIYQDCKDWDEKEMITRNSVEEINDWIRHTKEVIRIDDLKNTNEANMMDIIFMYISCKKNRYRTVTTNFEIRVI